MATPLINGVNYSWANISVILFGQPVIGIVSIMYKAKQEKKNNYGSGTEPVSRGYGRTGILKGAINKGFLDGDEAIIAFQVSV